MYSVNQMRHTASAQFKFNSQGYIYHNIQKFCLKKISTSVRPKNTLQIHRDKTRNYIQSTSTNHHLVPSQQS